MLRKKEKEKEEMVRRRDKVSGVKDRINHRLHLMGSHKVFPCNDIMQMLLMLAMGMLFLTKNPSIKAKKWLLRGKVCSLISFSWETFDKSFSEFEKVYLLVLDWWTKSHRKYFVMNTFLDAKFICVFFLYSKAQRNTIK